MEGEQVRVTAAEGSVSAPSPKGIAASKAYSFQLLLELHTPLILPLVVPRLDTLLQEAACRRALDWSRYATLPLVFDEARGGYRASQLIFGVTPHAGLEAQPQAKIAQIHRLPLLQARNVRAPLRIDGGDWAPKMTHHQALLSPYVLFYAEGDPDACIDLLQELPQIGIGHNHGQGMIRVASVSPDSGQRWRQRPWRQIEEHAGMAYTPLADTLRMASWREDEPVFRPPRILREVLAGGST